MTQSTLITLLAFIFTVMTAAVMGTWFISRGISRFPESIKRQTSDISKLFELYNQLNERAMMREDKQNDRLRAIESKLDRLIGALEDKIREDL